MKRMTEEYGKTVEEAIRKGLETLKVSREDVKILVIDEPSNGMLGILSSKMAKVRLTVEKKVDDEQVGKTVEKANEILGKIFEITGDSSTFEVTAEDGKVLVKIASEGSAHLIGYKGKTIEAIQSTINSILQKEEEEYAKVFVEVNDYKVKKEERLKELARKMARNAVKFGRDVRLEPMSAYERMIIHTELANRTDVKTESYGEEPRRRVVIKKIR
ncbi:MAG: Jag N-terminal domain-containing protein [Clostridia bacterium]|nr:Jag N-terminal domain-containing protein [Clostridia bacterium]